MIRRPGPVAVAFLLLLAGLLIPVFAVRMPPLLDYPNHVSRLWLLGGGAAMPPLSSIYAVEWTALTNIGIDLLAVPLTRLFSAETVGAIYLALGITLVPLGTALLNRSLHGPLTWWSLGFPLLAWNGAVLAGFLNFEIGLGAALLAAAADGAIARRGPAPAFLARAAIAAALTLLHLFALGFYAALLCGLALGPELRALRSRAGLARAALRLLPPLAAVGLVLIGFLLAAPALPGAHSAANAGSLLGDLRGGFGGLLSWQKAKSALAWLWTYDLRLDLAMLVLALLPAGYAAWRGRVRIHGGLLLVAAGLGLLFVLVPFQLAGTFWVDRRFAFMAPFVLAAAVRPELPRQEWRIAAAALLFALSLGRSGFILQVWQLRQADVAATERVLALVPPGSAVLPVEHRPPPRNYGPLGRYFGGGEASYGQYPTLAVRERLAFVPTLFTARGKQPLRVLPPWDAIAVPEGWLVTVHALTDPAAQKTHGWAAPYTRMWRDHYDYVLVVNADMPDAYGPFVPPAELSLIADEGFARLYHIRREAGGLTAAR